MKNILIIHSSLEGGGAERVLVEYLNSFDLTQYKITLFLVLKSCKQHYLSAIPSQIKVIFISNSLVISKLDYILYRLGLHSKIEKRQLKRQKIGNYDIIISFMEGLALKYHSHLTNKANRNITWVHIDFSKNHWSKIFFKSNSDECNIYNKMSDIVFVSKDAKISFNDMFAINENMNQNVVNNPIDKNRIIVKSSEYVVKKNKFTVIGVGRLGGEKRFDRFIDVLKLIIDKNIDIEFWILGSGELELELKAKAKKLGIKDKIIFKGFIDNPYPHIKAADIFLLTSDAEGYPTVICESIVLGTPVIMTKVSGATELLGNSEYGIITKDMTPEVIAREVVRLYYDKELYNSYVTKLQKRSEIFETDRTMKEIYNLLNNE